MVATSAKYFLLRNVGDRCAGRLGVARLAIVAARRRGERQTGCGQGCLYFGRERNSIRRPRDVVEDDRLLAVARNAVKHQRRPVFAERRRGEAVRVGGVEDRLLADEIAVEMPIEFAEHGIDFGEGRHRSVGGRDGHGGVEGIAVDAGVAQLVAGPHRRGIGHGEGGKQRMRVGEIDAAVAQRRHRRRGLGAHLQRAQPVRNEQDEVLRLRPAVGASGEP